MTVTENEKVMLVESDQRSKSNTHQIEEVKDKLEKLENKTEDIHIIATNIQLISQDITYMKKDISVVKDGQSNLEQRINDVKNSEGNKLVSRWDKIKDNLGWLFIGGIAAYALGQIFSMIKF